MASKKSDQDLIAQVVRELQAAGEDFTLDAAELLMATRTTAKQPQLGPGDRMSADDTQRVLSAFGPQAVAALGAVSCSSLRVRGDGRVFWIERIVACDPEDEELPVFFDGRSWQDAPTGPEGLSVLLGTLTIDLHDEGVRESVLQACEAVLGHVVRNAEQATALTRVPPDGATFEAPPSAAPVEVLRHFEPPHVAGGAFIFCVNVGYDRASRGPAFLRLTLDMDTQKLDAQRLCRGQNPGARYVLEGRAFVADDGAPLLAPVLTPHQRSAERAVVAWQDAAAAEHASIASFARATLELMAVGAPLSLVARTQEAAVDEVRHARLSLAVARRLAGDDNALTGLEASATTDDDAFGPLPVVGPRAASIALVATTTLLEAAVPETLAAFAAGVAAKRCRHDDVCAVLDEIHGDETRHAALAWDIVDWCAEHDDDARAAVSAIAAQLTPPTASASLVDSDDDGQLMATSELKAYAVAFQERVLPRLRRLGR